MYAIWTDFEKRPQFEALKEDLRTDVLIIGGGLTGLLCAYKLAKAGVDYALLEAKQICGGITGDTTAKITLQHGLIYSRLIRRFGAEKAQMYLQANEAAIRQYEALCRKIDCDFEKKDAFVYSPDDRAKIEQEVMALNQLGCPAKFTEKLPLPFAVAGAVRVTEQAQFHPLKFAYSLAEGLRIFENTKVQELKPGQAIADGKTVTAKKIIIATHFPLLNKHGGYFLKLYQHRSYVLALKNAPDVKGMYVDESESGLSFRNYNGLLLLGGGGHRTGKKGGDWRELTDFARRHYPDSRTVSRWATQDCMSLDGVPYIGRYAKGARDLYVATGFNKWGMTSAMVAADLLTDAVLERENPYQAVFSPQRSVFRPQLAINAAESLTGILTPTAPRCPHMGCALKYNRAEHSWDCPCHGSRFTKEGELINNPATDDKRL